jgi:starvation-inducible DNA-binding protein
MRKTNLGMSEQQRRSSIDALNGALANASILLIKTKKFHWDVVGPQFLTLHRLWDEQYESIAGYVDELAERVRMLGGLPIGTAAGFLDKSVIREHPGDVGNATQAVSMLLTDHETVVRTLREAIGICEKDAGSADFLTRLLEHHEKMSWMLRSFLEGEGVASDGVTQTRSISNMA